MDTEPSLRSRRLARLLRAMVGLPEPFHRLVRGARPHNDRGDRLERDVAMLCRLQRLDPMDVEGLTPPRARRRLLEGVGVVEGPPLPVAAIVDATFPAATGPARLRAYVPRADAPLPALLYFHGGGWAVGDLRSHDRACRRLAVEGDQVVLAVDYRLAPEHPFPAGLDDAVAAVRWARAHARTFGAAPGRLAIGGDSAGGNLTAATCLRLRDEGELQPAFQLLIYPATDLRRQTASYRLLGEGYLLTHASMDWYLACYAAPIEHPRASVVLEPDLSALAPAIVVTAGFDPLRDEGEAYAARLREAGVPVEHLAFPGQIHGFLNLDGALPSASAATAAVSHACRRAWRGTEVP